jgi:septal ring factor EnvC (AmiA/AmiB activator)
MAVHVPSPGDVLITPRVLDQASFDDLAASLQALIKQAGTAAGDLRGTLGELAEGRAETARSSGFLQERLRVSARMLKAFQTQIEHAEALLETLRRRQQGTERAMAQIDERIDLAGDRAEALARLVESAEVNIAVLAHKTAQAASQGEARAAELAELLARGETGGTHRVVVRAVPMHDSSASSGLAVHATRV